MDTKHSGKRAQVSLQQQVVKPLYDSRPGTRIIIELAKQLGVAKYFDFDIEEGNRLRLKPLGVTLEELKEKGVLFVGEKWKEGVGKLDTPSGKVEIQSKILEQLGYPAIPRWEEPLVSPDPKDPASFRLLHGKQAIHTHSMTANQPVLMNISHRYDMVRLWMNRERGRQLGSQGRRLGFNQIDRRRGKDPGAVDRGHSPLLRVASQRIRGFLETLEDRFRHRAVVQ